MVTHLVYLVFDLVFGCITLVGVNCLQVDYEFGITGSGASCQG